MVVAGSPIEIVGAYTSFVCLHPCLIADVQHGAHSSLKHFLLRRLVQHTQILHAPHDAPIYVKLDYKRMSSLELESKPRLS
jgi:hypothetical protein